MRLPRYRYRNTGTFKHLRGALVCTFIHMVVTSECLKLQGEPAVAAAKHSAKFRRLASLFFFSLRFIALCKPCMRVLPCACVIKGGMASGRPFHPYTRHVALELGGTLNSRPWLNTWLIGMRKSMSSAEVPFEVFRSEAAATVSKPRWASSCQSNVASSSLS